MNVHKQKRLLSLDGGGILGLISICILEEVEEQLRAAHGNDPSFRLRDYFDYIGGTSTGAIIAAGLSIGKSARELREFYIDHGASMFAKAPWYRRFWYKYHSSNLAKMLQKEFTASSILELQERGDLKSDRHLLVVARNMETASPWPISTNPQAKFNNGAPQDNRHLPLWKLVRASAAAPVYFTPEELEFADGKKFLFEDGGVTPYNNPAFLLYRMATEPRYKCCWEDGEERMMLVSVGTGISSSARTKPKKFGKSLYTNARHIPTDLMAAFSVEQDISCRTIGRCVHGENIDLELGNLVSEKPSEKRFLYARYNADLTDTGLKKMGFDDIDANALELDNTNEIDNLLKIGRAVASEVNFKQHFPTFLPALEAV